MLQYVCNTSARWPTLAIVTDSWQGGLNVLLKLYKHWQAESFFNLSNSFWFTKIAKTASSGQIILSTFQQEVVILFPLCNFSQCSDHSMLKYIIKGLLATDRAGSASNREHCWFVWITLFWYDALQKHRPNIYRCLVSYSTSAGFSSVLPFFSYFLGDSLQ